MKTCLHKVLANRPRERQKANQPNAEKLQQERDDALAKVTQMENEKLLTSKGVRADDLDYVMFKVSRMVDEKTAFDKAAEKFLKENPRFTGKPYRVMSTSAQAAVLLPPTCNAPLPIFRFLSFGVVF